MFKHFRTKIIHLIQLFFTKSFIYSLIMKSFFKKSSLDSHQSKTIFIHKVQKNILNFKWNCHIDYRILKYSVNRNNTMSIQINGYTVKKWNKIFLHVSRKIAMTFLKEITHLVLRPFFVFQKSFLIFSENYFSVVDMRFHCIIINVFFCFMILHWFYSFNRVLKNNIFNLNPFFVIFSIFFIFTSNFSFFFFLFIYRGIHMFKIYSIEIVSNLINFQNKKKNEIPPFRWLWSASFTTKKTIIKYFKLSLIKILCHWWQESKIAWHH